MKKLIIIFVVIFSASSFGQGLNNSNPFDQIDFENCFSLLGITAFKFPIFSEHSSRLNGIIEYYDSDSLVSVHNQQELLEQNPFHAELPQILPDTNWFRIYLYQHDGKLTLMTNYLNESSFLTLDNFDYETTGSRAYDFTNIESCDNCYVLIWYGKKERNKVSHCPLGAPPEHVAKEYDRVIAFKLELIKEE